MTKGSRKFFIIKEYIRKHLKDSIKKCMKSPSRNVYKNHEDRTEYSTTTPLSKYHRNDLTV